jgi:hypothetical protein
MTVRSHRPCSVALAPLYLLALAAGASAQTLPTTEPINVTKLSAYHAGWANAVPNHNNDDSAAVQAVVTFLMADPTRVNRTLYFPAGRYNFFASSGSPGAITAASTTASVVDGVSFVGDGSKSELVLGRVGAQPLVGTGTLLTLRRVQGVDVRGLSFRAVRGTGETGTPRAIHMIAVRRARLDGLTTSAFLQVADGVVHPGAIVVQGESDNPGTVSAISSDDIQVTSCKFFDNGMPSFESSTIPRRDLALKGGVSPSPSSPARSDHTRLWRCPVQLVRQRSVLRSIRKATRPHPQRSPRSTGVSP